jgi:hypothetical protein
MDFVLKYIPPSIGAFMERFAGFFGRMRGR